MTRNKYNNWIKEQIISDYKKKSISEKYSISKSVISRIINRFRSTRSVLAVHSGGRPRKTSHRSDQKIIREIKKHPSVTSTELVMDLSLKVSTRTVRRIAVEAGLYARKPSKKPFISAKNRKASLAFAKAHIHWHATR